MIEQNKSIVINLPLIGSDKTKILNTLDEEKLIKPKQYAPVIESFLKKKIGYDFADIKNTYPELFYYSIDQRSIAKLTSVEDILRNDKAQYYIKYKENNNCYLPNNYRDAFIKIENYLKEYKSHTKIKAYLDNEFAYRKRLGELNKKYTFAGSIYDNPGYLLTLENKRTGRVFTFLIGTRQYIKNSFGADAYNIMVLRAKKVISDEEIEGMQIFE